MPCDKAMLNDSRPSLDQKGGRPEWTGDDQKEAASLDSSISTLRRRPVVKTNSKARMYVRARSTMHKILRLRGNQGHGEMKEKKPVRSDAKGLVASEKMASKFEIGGPGHFMQRSAGGEGQARDRNREL